MFYFNDVYDPMPVCLGYLCEYLELCRMCFLLQAVSRQCEMAADSLAAQVTSVVMGVQRLVSKTFNLSPRCNVLLYLLM